MDRLEAALDGITRIQLTADASEVTSATETAVDQADTLAEVQGDASEVTSDVTAAVDAADTLATVEGDASEVTSDVSAAVDAADTLATVEGDASQVTGAVDSAVDAADTSIELTADDSQVRQATSAVDDLGGSLDDAVVQAGALRGAVAAISIVAAAEGFRRLVDAASELEQAVGGTQAVFGEAAGDVESFAQTAAESAGLTETAARTLTSQLGGLLQGFGFTQREAAETSVVLAQLGADLAATFGGASVEAVEALGAALRGEFDPLERFGISLNVTRANLKAVELGLADSTSEVDLNARAQASLALIMESSANAQGQFAREASTTAGQLERAQAEAGGAAAAVGQTLQPAMNELIATVRADTIPALEELGVQLGPSLVNAIQSVLPLFGSTTGLLTTLTPVIDAAASALSAIPAPVLQAVAAFALLRRLGAVDVLRAIGSALATAGLNVAAFAQRTRAAGATAVGAAAHFGTFRGATVGLGSAFSGLASSIGPGVLATAGLTAALLILSNAQQRAAERAAEHRERVETLRAALAESGSVTQGITTGFEQLAESSDEAAQAIAAAGFTAEEFTNFVANADNLIEATRDLAEAAGIATLNQNDLGKANRDLLDDIGAAVAAADELARTEIEAAFAAGEITEAKRDQLLATENVIAAWEEESQAVQQAQRNIDRLIEAEVEVAKAQGEITAEQARGVLSADDLERAWEELQAEIESANQTTSVAAQILATYRDATGATAEANVAFAEALRTMRVGLGEIDTATQIASGDLRIFGVDTQQLADVGVARLEDGLTRLALAFDSGAVSAEDLEAAAAELGVNVQDLQPALQVIADTVNGYASAAERAVSDTTALAESMTEGFDIGTFFENMEKATEATRNFQENLARLIEEGFAGLAAAGLEQGPAFTQAIIDALDAGELATVEGWEDIIAENKAAQDSLVAAVLETFGPQLAQALGITMEQLIAILGEEFGKIPDIARKTDQEVIEQISAADAWPTFAGQYGRRGADRFEQGISPMPGRAGRAVGRAADAVLAGTGSMGGAGRSVGRAAADGMSSGASSAAGRVATQVASAIDGVSARVGFGRSAGSSVGGAIGDGMSSGVRSRRSSVIDAAVDIATSAINAATDSLGIGSPSRVFAEIGSQTGEGFVLGLANSTADVVREAEAITRAAARAASGGITVDPAVTGALASTAAGTGGGTVINIGREAVVINLPAGTTPSQARQAGQAAARGFLTTIAQRQVFVDAQVA